MTIIQNKVHKIGGGTGVRYTISETARREILDRLVELNYQRHAGEQTDLVPVKKKRSGGKRRSASHNNLSLGY